MASVISHLTARQISLCRGQKHLKVKSWLRHSHQPPKKICGHKHLLLLSLMPSDADSQSVFYWFALSVWMDTKPSVQSQGPRLFQRSVSKNVLINSKSNSRKTYQSTFNHKYNFMSTLRFFISQILWVVPALTVRQKHYALDLYRLFTCWVIYHSLQNDIMC